MLGKKIYLSLFIIGLIAGLLFAVGKAKASSPIREASPGTIPASVYYDESWKAVETVVSTVSGLKKFYPYGSNPGYPLPEEPSNKTTDPAGKLEVKDQGSGFQTCQVTMFPKMIVTKWNVHGHIHFGELPH